MASGATRQRHISNVPRIHLFDFLIPTATLLIARLAVRRQRSGIGWYSFMLWDQVVSPECWFQKFVSKNGSYTYDTSPSTTAQWEECYQVDPRRPEVDLFEWKPTDSAHCWVFQVHWPRARDKVVDERA